MTHERRPKCKENQDAQDPFPYDGDPNFSRKLKIFIFSRFILDFFYAELISQLLESLFWEVIIADYGWYVAPWILIYLKIQKAKMKRIRVPRTAF